MGGGGGGDGRGETSWANERVVEGFDGQVAGLWDKTRWYVRRWRHVAYRWFCGNGEQVLTLVQAWAPWRIRQAMFNAADAPVLWRVNGLQNVGGVARLTLHVSSGAPSTHPGEGYLKSSLPHYLTEKWGAREVGQDIFSVLHEKHTHPHPEYVHAASEPLIFIVFHFFIFISLHKRKLDMFLLHLNRTRWACRLWEFLHFLSVHFQICEELFCKGIRI